MADLEFQDELDAKTRGQRDANWALALAILSIVCCAPLTSPFALWKAMKAMKAQPAAAKPVFALVIACLGLATSAFFWFLAIWQFLSPADRTPTHIPIPMPMPTPPPPG